MHERARRLTSVLIEVLDAIEAHEHAKQSERKSIARDFGLLRLSEFQDLYKAGEFFIADPIGYGLRKSVRKVGKLLARDFSSDMHEIAELAAEAQSARHSGIRADIIDKNWDGIAMADGGVWAA